MLHQSTLDYLTNLKTNNNKEWFEKNRKAYDAARTDQLAFITSLLFEMAKWEERVKNVDPKKCTMRINRDIRFSKDKSPYKSNMSFGINPPGTRAGYYFHLEPGATFAGGGLYGLEPLQIKAVRQEIDYNLNEFSGIMNNAKFKKHFSKLDGDALQNIPKDYPKDHPGAEWLKHKDFVIGTKLDDKELTSNDLLKKTNELFRTMQPFMLFMDRALQ